MKGRSNRLQSSDPPEDWVNGSWTVDCVCGVNYDDGEEMVNCDECGVWVHTRCSRYVKGDVIFVCDKCKGKIACNDSEETEVAQLLVELPTKTVRMECNYASNKPPRHPRRLWTEKPMEERVHVQGIPGGDPTLFRGLSSVFTRELWKSSGYIPKKFNFQYKEFPCWDEKLETGGKNDDGNESPDNNGAGVLFSLSKETVLPTPVATLTDFKRNVEDGVCDKKASLKESIKWEINDIDIKQGMEKERNILQPVLLHSGNRKKENLVTIRDRSGKRKARTSDKKDDTKKIISHYTKTVLALSHVEKQSELHGGRVQTNSKNDSQSTKSNILQESVVCGPALDVPVLTEKNLEQSNNMKSPHEQSSGAFSSEMYGNNVINGSERMEEKADSQIPLVVSKSSSKTDSPGSSLLERTDAGKFSIKQEGDDAMINASDSVRGSARFVGKSSDQDLSSVKSEIKGSFDGDVSLNSAQAKMELQHDRESPNIQSSLGNAKELGILTNQMSENLKVNDGALCSSQSDGHKMQEVNKGSESVSDYCSDLADGQSNGPCHYNGELDCSKGFKAVESSSDPKKGSLIAAEQSKPAQTVLNHKIALSTGKSSLVPTTIVVTSKSSSFGRKECYSNDVIRDEEREEKPRKTIEELPKSDSNSSPKRLMSNRTSKDFVVYSSSKASSANITKANTGSGESKGPLRDQKQPLHAHDKTATSGLSQKGEKYDQIHVPTSSKVTQNYPYPPVPSNIHANLSDEELALLLHQELNSSPRVPRVPRLRHSGSLPQLPNPTAASILIKHSSSSGGKDLGSASRRKVKDVSKDSVRNYRDADDEAKKSARLPHSSPDQRKNVASPATDASMKRDDIRSSTRMVVRKNMSSASTTASSGPSSSTEVNDRNLSSIWNSPRNTSDEDTGTVGGPANRTLPVTIENISMSTGLIDEILSKDRRLSYEELCDAVLPHWHTLRKHNGDRYAYSSHSQAVLDCLRNRYEWAQLVDRVPKTNSSRKRHKLDADESEDSEQGKGRTTRGLESKSLDSHKEEFPKGKRKARKRRRLALQGRGVKDLRKRRKPDIINDEARQVTVSSEESIFSEDEIREGGSEASDSSEEAGNL